MSEIMTNPNADRVRDVAKLSGRSARLRRGEFLAEGPQVVREALKAHHAAEQGGSEPVVRQLFVTEGQLSATPDLEELLSDVDYRLVTPQVLAAMSTTVTPQGIIAVCTIPEIRLDDVLAGDPKLLAILCQVRDPGNAGTMLRAADSAGADAVVFTEGSVDPFNPKAVRSTVGSLFHLPMVGGVGLEQLVSQLDSRQIQVLAADGYGQYSLDALQDESALRRLSQNQSPSPNVDPDPNLKADQNVDLGPNADQNPNAGADNSIVSAPVRAAAPDPTDTPGATPQAATEAATEAGPDLARPTAWLFGNEAQGLSEEERAAAQYRIAVPIYGQAESLNVATAATVCLYASARAQH